MLFIGICGPSSSGKTTIAKNISKLVGEENCLIVSQDNFYKGLKYNDDPANYNFDSPDAIDFDLMRETLKKCKNEPIIKMPIYNFTTHAVDKYVDIENTFKIIIFEGIFGLYDEIIREMMDIKIFIRTDLDICLLRRIKRDTTERGRSIESIMNQYIKFVKPSFHQYIVPQKEKADIIIPNGGENILAISIIEEFIKSRVHV